MAQLLFETMPASGISLDDNTEVVTVQGIMDQPNVLQSQAATSVVDSDVFFCGKCKKQFLSLEAFIGHKTNCNAAMQPMPSRVGTAPENTVLVRKFQIPPNFAHYPPNIVLTEGDLMQLSSPNINPSTNAVVTTRPNTQAGPNHVLLPQAAFGSHAIPSRVQHVIHPAIGEDFHQPQAVELSIVDIDDPRHIILTNQPHNVPMSNVVLNLGNVVESTPVLCENVEIEDNGSGRVIIYPITEVLQPMNMQQEPVYVQAEPNNVGSEPASTQVITPNVQNESNNIENEPDNIQNDPENNPDDPNSTQDNLDENQENSDTVNIINEFHSSMVKSNKAGTDKENEGDQNKKDTKLSCAYCMRTFGKNFDLQQHIRSHTGEKPFQCIVCGRGFAQKTNVKKHMQTHKVWPNGLSRTLPYMSKKNSSKNGEAENCPDEPDDPAMNREGENLSNAYACPYCSFIGENFYKLKSHMTNHEMKKVYKCIFRSCGQMISDLDDFLEHVKTHENEMTYNCHECNKNFETLYELGSHQFTHSLYPSVKPKCKKRYLQCTFCLSKFETKQSLDHHMSVAIHTYPCPQCNKIFPCERYLKRHLQIHSDDIFKCDICGKEFKAYNYLRTHLITHTVEKPFVCDVCNAAFNRKFKLKRHSLIHQTIKPFKCPYRSLLNCLKEFGRVDKLKDHMLTHGTAKCFTCNICNKQFARKYYLRCHMKVHRKEKKLKKREEQDSPNSCQSNLDSANAKINPTANKKRKQTSNDNSTQQLKRQKKKTALSGTKSTYQLRKRTGRLITLNYYEGIDEDEEIEICNKQITKDNKQEISIALSKLYSEESKVNQAENKKQNQTPSNESLQQLKGQKTNCVLNNSKQIQEDAENEQEISIPLSVTNSDESKETR